MGRFLYMNIKSMTVTQMKKILSGAYDTLPTPSILKTISYSYLLQPSYLVRQYHCTNTYSLACVDN